MTSQQLPERANLEQLKKQAKSLLHAAQAKEPAALQRFQVLPALAQLSLTELGTRSLALHDAQSVIAREYGFKSWNQLREHVQDRSLSFAAAVDEFVRCATGGAPARALRLLGRTPQLPAPICTPSLCSAIRRRWRRGCGSIPRQRFQRAEFRIGSRFFTSVTLACIKRRLNARPGSSG